LEQTTVRGHTSLIKDFEGEELVEMIEVGICGPCSGWRCIAAKDLQSFAGVMGATFFPVTSLCLELVVEVSEYSLVSLVRCRRSGAACVIMDTEDLAWALFDVAGKAHH
jgi:hypothetical protein